MTANALTESVLKYLNIKGFLAWRQNNGGIYDPTKKVFRANSSYRGVSDIIAIEPKTGRFWGIEIKIGKDKQSVFQTVFQKDVEKRNGKYLVVKSLDDIIKSVDESIRTEIR